MRFNIAKQKMLEGTAAIGAYAGVGSPMSAEILAKAGYDYVLLDEQHAPWTLESMQSSFRGILAAGSVPMARVGKNDFYAIGSMLDRGALGIVVPMVHTTVEAMAAVYAARYQPQGSRSIGAYCTAMYDRDYVQWANDEVFLAVQIESQSGLDNVEEIMSVDGVDGCWIGPADLGASMGLDPNKPEDLETRERAILHILDACKKTSKVPGIACLGEGEQRIKEGFKFVTPVADFPAGLEEQLAHLRRVAGQ